MSTTEDRENFADAKIPVADGLEGSPSIHHDAFFRVLEVACASAIQKWINITDVSPRRLLSPRESAKYLSLSEREVYKAA